MTDRSTHDDISEEDEIRRLLHRGATATPHPFAAAEARARRGRSRWPLAGGLALSAMVLMLAVWARSSAEVAQAPTATPLTTGTASPAASPTPVPSFAWAGLRWSPPSPVPDALAFSDAVSVGTNLVVSAEVVDGVVRRGAVYTSTDGGAWTRTATFASTPRIFKTATRVLAVVNAPGSAGGVEVSSSVDGRTWQLESRLGLPSASLTSAASRGDVLVALGNDAAGRTLLWRSASGTAWATVALPSTQAIPRDVVALADGFLLVGRDGEPDRASGGVGQPGSGRPAAWWSPDGSSWQPTPVDGFVAPGAQLSRVFPVASGYFAVGSDALAPTNPRAPQIWISSDGRSWASVGQPAHWGLVGSNTRDAIVLAPADFGTVALGAWRSGDGRTWTPLTFSGDLTRVPTFEAAVDHPTRVDNVFVSDRGVLVIGQVNGRLTTWFADAVAH